MSPKTILLFALCLVFAACGNQPAANTAAVNSNTNSTAKPAANRSAEEATLKEADLAWSAAAGKLDVDGSVGFYTDDGTILSPNVPASKGKEALKKEWSGLLGLKGLAMSWEPTLVQVAESGEIGYTNGTWKMAWTDPKQGKVSDHGKYLEQWKKVDGKWKCYLDMYSSDQAAPIPVK